MLNCYVAIVIKNKVISEKQFKCGVKAGLTHSEIIKLIAKKITSSQIYSRSERISPKKFRDFKGEKHLEHKTNNTVYHLCTIGFKNDNEQVLSFAIATDRDITNPTRKIKMGKVGMHYIDWGYIPF